MRDGEYNFGGLEGEGGRFEPGSPFTVAMSYIYIVLLVFVDWIILAEQISGGLIWTCYPPTQSTYCV